MRIGPYTVVAELGRGGSGAVYRARSPRGEDVAVKVLLRGDAEARARFDRERRLLERLGDADGFVPLLDAGTTEAGAAYVVMPLLPGGTLRARLERGPLPVAEALDLVRALAHAVGRAHALGVVHRDLKPENVLFTADGAPRVADLGLAKRFRRDEAHSASLSHAGGFRGTVAYVAPEQVVDARAAGPPADVYALGAVLFEALTGRPPCWGGSFAETLVQVLEAAPLPRVRSLRPEVPPWLDEVVARALERDPARRFPDAAALAHALMTTRRRRRRRGPAAAGLGLAGLLALAAAAAVVARRRAAPPAPPPAPAPPGPARASPAPAAPAPRDEALREALERAAAALDRGDHDRAHDELTRALERDPTLASAWANRAVVRVKRGDLAGALADDDRAVALAPTDARVLTNRGIVKQRLGDTAGALADYGRALEHDPTLAQAWANRAMMRALQGDMDGAATGAERAIALDPRESNGWYTRGLTRAHRGDADGAADDFGRCLALDPTRASAWFNRGASRAARDLDGAIDDLTRALALDPGQVEAWANRGLYRLERGAPGDAEEALADLGEALRRRPAEAFLAVARARARIATGDRPGARAELLEVLRRDDVPAVVADEARALLAELDAQ